MVEAGVEALAGKSADDWPFEDKGALAIAVYEAMQKARPLSLP